MRRNPTALSGAPRSLMNTYRPDPCFRCSRRSALSSVPVSGCTDGIPFLARDTWRRPQSQVDLFPAKRTQFRHPQSMPEGQEDHGGVAVSVAIVVSRLHKPLNLALGEVFTGPIVGVRQPTSCNNCSLLGGSCPGD